MTRAYRRRRLIAGQVGLLAILGGLSLINETLLSIVVSVVLVVSVPFVTFVAYQLDRLSARAPEIDTLADAADAALASAVESWLLGIVGLLVLARIAGILTILVGPAIVVFLAFVLVDRCYPSFRWLVVAHDVWVPMVRRREGVGSSGK